MCILTLLLFMCLAHRPRQQRQPYDDTEYTNARPPLSTKFQNADYTPNIVVDFRSKLSTIQHEGVYIFQANEEEWKW